jgi:hypothetical protein
MRTVFNVVMRVFNSLLGALLVFMGGIWILQGLHVPAHIGAFDISKSFMWGNVQWTAWGAVLALLGLGEIVWSNTRKT